MSMFNKLKQIKDLRDKAKKVQDLLGGEEVTASVRGVTIKMDGLQKVTHVEISDDMMRPEAKHDLEKAMIEVFADALKKLQKVVAEKMRQNGDFNLPGLN